MHGEAGCSRRPGGNSLLAGLPLAPSFFLFVPILHHRWPFQLTSWQKRVNTETQNCYFHTLHRRLSCSAEGSALKLPTSTTITAIFGPHLAHSLLSNHPITTRHGQFAALPNLTSGAKQFAITQNSISPAHAAPGHTTSQKLPLSTNTPSPWPHLTKISYL